MWTPSTAPTTPRQLVAIETAATELGYKGQDHHRSGRRTRLQHHLRRRCSNIYYINNINTEDETIAAKIAEIQNDVSAPPNK